MLFVFLLIIGPNVSTMAYQVRSGGPDSVVTGDPTLSKTLSSTYGIAIYDFDLWDFNGLCDSLGVGYNYEGYCEVIESFFLPMNIRFVGFTGIDSWLVHATTPNDTIPFSQEVDTILDACDAYGIGVFFEIPGGQWGASGIPPSWDASVIAAHPELQTYDRDGNPKQPGEKPCYVIDNPLLFEQFKDDIARIYEMYGSHPSWIGFYNGVPGGDYAHYVGSTSSNIVDTGYTNYTMRNYVNSPYFAQVVDLNTGLLYQDGSPSKLYDTFYVNKPLMEFGYGTWEDFDYYYGAYGGKDLGTSHVYLVEFEVPENLEGFKIEFYGGMSGSVSTPLMVELYENIRFGNQPDFDKLKETHQISVSSEGWYEITWSSRLAETDKYWLLFYTNGGDQDNFYEVYRSTFAYDPYAVVEYSESGINTPYWKTIGTTVLYLKDMDGNNVKIYPKQVTAMSVSEGGNVDQHFVAPRNITFNNVWIEISDRAYNEATTALQVIRAGDMQVLASGVLDQRAISGLYHFITIPLDARITVEAGKEYIIRIVASPTDSGAGWQWHKLVTEPAEAGFQGQEETLWFRLADMNIVIQNFMRCNEINVVGYETWKDGVTTTNWYATRFQPTVSSPLQTVDVKLTDSSGGTLKISLRGESDGFPASTELESKTVSMSNGWLSTSGWTTNLVADNYYWLVFSATSGSCRLLRNLNPIEYKPAWSDDTGATWQRFPEVGEILFKATTNAGQVFKVEPEDMIDNEQVTISKTKFVAQSFTSASSFQAKGAIVYMAQTTSCPPVDITVELVPDDGSGKPDENSILARGTLNPSIWTRADVGLHYIDFEFPYTVAAGTRYWLVFKSSGTDNYAGPRVYTYFFREPQDSFGGTDEKTLGSTDSGQTWYLMGGREGDIIFAVVEAPFPITTYSIPELAAEIETYHYKDNRNEPLEGWNTYLNFWCSLHLKNILEWFEGYTGEKWIGLDVNCYGMVEEVGGQDYLYTYNAVTGPLPPNPPSDSELRDDCLRKVRELLTHGGIGLYSEGSLGHSQDNTGAITAEQIGYYYRSTVPLLARGLHAFDVDAPHLANDTQQQWSRFYGDILSKMRYYGGYFGNEKSAVKALFIGDQDIGITPQFLTPAIDITLEGFMGFSGDYNLTKYGDFKQFDVIVGFSGRPSLSELSTDAQERIKAFVSDGGGLVCFGGYPSWASEIFANSQIIPVDHVINSPYTASDFIDSRPQISVSSYDSGRGIVMQLKRSWLKLGTDPDVPGAPRDSILVLITNSILYAGGKESLIPAWWYSQYRDFQPWNKDVYYSICGKPGSPVLLWLSNNGESTDFEIHLNALFYGIDPTGWVAIDVQNWEVVAKGSGTDIKINTTIPAESWRPIYIMNDTSDLQALYSNIFLIGQSTDTTTATYVVEGPYKQTSWLLVNNMEQPVSVSANNTGSLNEYSLEDLNSGSTMEGWHYDSTNKVLYIKFHTTSPVQVSISITVVPEFPTWMQLLATFAAITTLVVLAKRKLKRSFLWKKKQVTCLK
jgi:hypothetical protein